MTRIEISKNKLERLKKELDDAIEADFNHVMQTNGQPMNDKRNGSTWFKQQEQKASKIFQLQNEIKQQEERVEHLSRQEWLKDNHMTANGGLQNSVHNLEEFKSRKQDKKTRNRVALLESIVEKEKQDKTTMSISVRKLIESGKVSKWDKKPVYYFVKGLRKVALMVDKNGDFIVSKTYPCKDEEDELFVKKLLEEVPNAK